MNGLVDGVRSFVCVSNAEVEDAVDFNLHIVACDGILLVNVQYLLLQRVIVGYCVNEGPLEV